MLRHRVLFFFFKPSLLRMREWNTVHFKESQSVWLIICAMRLYTYINGKYSCDYICCWDTKKMFLWGCKWSHDGAKSFSRPWGGGDANSSFPCVQSTSFIQMVSRLHVLLRVVFCLNDEGGSLYSLSLSPCLSFINLCQNVTGLWLMSGSQRGCSFCLAVFSAF